VSEVAETGGLRFAEAMRLLIIFAAVGLCACGNPNPSGVSMATVTLSGGVTGNANTTVAAATEASGVGFALSTSTGDPTVDVAIVLTTSTLQTGSYTESSSSVSKAGITVSHASMTPPLTWAVFARESGSPDQGTFTLDITSTGSAITGSSGMAWPDVHGNLTATLEPVTGTGADGSTTLAVTF